MKLLKEKLENYLAKEFKVFFYFEPYIDRCPSIQKKVFKPAFLALLTLSLMSHCPSEGWFIKKKIRKFKSYVISQFSFH